MDNKYVNAMDLRKLQKSTRDSGCYLQEVESYL